MKDNTRLIRKNLYHGEYILLKARVVSSYERSFYIFTYDGQKFQLETQYEEMETEHTSLEKILEIMFYLIDEDHPLNVVITMNPTDPSQGVIIEQAYKAWRERSNAE